MQMNEEFRQRLMAYANGTADEAERQRIEQELREIEAYREVIDDLLREQEGEAVSLDRERQERILRSSRRKAHISTVSVALVALLLVTPIASLATLSYYAFGNRAAELRHAVMASIEITEPNLKVDAREAELDVSPFFTMSTRMKLVKQVGGKQVYAGEQVTSFVFSRPEKHEREMRTEPLPTIPMPDNIPFLHPEKQGPDDFLSSARIGEFARGWDQLSRLPEGTVAEAYLSFDRLYTPEQIAETLAPFDLELLWYAVDTGMEKTFQNRDGVHVPPIGYPAKPDEHPDSPFSPEKNNREQFLHELAFLAEREDVAVAASRSKVLNLQERLDYIRRHGIQVYGAVVTGPSKEILKLRQTGRVRGLLIGETALWNWR
jgi:hypothetical protein